MSLVCYVWKKPSVAKSQTSGDHSTASRGSIIYGTSDPAQAQERGNTCAILGAMREAGFEGGPQYDKHGNEKKNRHREYRNQDDDSEVRITHEGDVIRSTKGSRMKDAPNAGEKMVKKDGEWLRTRDQDIVHETRPSRGGQGEGIKIQ